MHELKNEGAPGNTSLGRVISAVRREIVAALEEKTPLPAGVRLEADRVVLSLRVAMTGDQRLQVLALAGEDVAAHTITIEFSVNRHEEPVQAVSAAREGRIEAATAEGVVNALMEVFGVPSFDSSARATVFRETVGGLPEEQIRRLIGALGNAGAAEVAGELKSPRRMITRLLEKGPAGVERSARVLQEIFDQHPMAPLLRIIEDTWKTPEAWAG